MQSLATSVRYLVITAAIGCSLAACKPEADGEMQWARAALERNQAVEIVATDADARVFTVRVRETGELVTVRLGSLVAGPAGTVMAAAAAPPPAEASVSQPPFQEPVQEPAAQPTAAEPAEAPAAEGEAEPAATSGYTVERSASGVRVSGPGVSIQTVGPPAGEAAEAARVVRGDSGIICEGPRLLQVDGRTLSVAGDAIVARDGCEIHITNSRIDASRIGVSVTGASVHISNSTVTGSFRSLDIADGGKVFARSTEFNGLVQRRGSGELADLGGNRWN